MNKQLEDDLLAALKIRYFELALLKAFSKGLVKGTTHTCIGQEYVPVALKPFVEDSDFVISNHRGHGHFIAMTGDIEGLFCEIMGKTGAVCNSVGGSQHLLHKNIMTTGVQGEGVSIGLGHAWKFKHEKSHNACFIFVGDGTFGRGSVYESLNMASLYRLPYILVVENNSIAMTTRLFENMAGTIEGRVKAFGINYEKVISHNPTEIKAQLQEPIKRAKEDPSPLVIEFITQRVASHSKGDDTRSKSELEKVQDLYWYNKLKKQENETFNKLDEIAKLQIESIVNKVLDKREITSVK